MPERVIPLKTAVYSLNVATLLDGRLAGTDDYVFQTQIMRSFMEDQCDWHGTAPKAEQYEQAMAELDAALAELEA